MYTCTSIPADVKLQPISPQEAERASSLHACATSGKRTKSGTPSHQSLGSTNSQSGQGEPQKRELEEISPCPS